MEAENVGQKAIPEKRSGSFCWLQTQNKSIMRYCCYKKKSNTISVFHSLKYDE